MNGSALTHIAPTKGRMHYKVTLMININHKKTLFFGI